MRGAQVSSAVQAAPPASTPTDRISRRPGVRCTPRPSPAGHGAARSTPGQVPSNGTNARTTRSGRSVQATSRASLFGWISTQSPLRRMPSGPSWSPAPRELRQDDDADDRDRPREQQHPPRHASGAVVPVRAELRCVPGCDVVVGIDTRVGVVVRTRGGRRRLAASQGSVVDRSTSRIVQHVVRLVDRGHVDAPLRRRGTRPPIGIRSG